MSHVLTPNAILASRFLCRSLQSAVCLRFFHFSSVASIHQKQLLYPSPCLDWGLQPRIGLSSLLSPTTPYIRRAQNLICLGKSHCVGHHAASIMILSPGSTRLHPPRPRSEGKYLLITLQPSSPSLCCPIRDKFHLAHTAPSTISSPSFLASFVPSQSCPINHAGRYLFQTAHCRPFSSSRPTSTWATASPSTRPLVLNHTTSLATSSGYGVNALRLASPGQNTSKRVIASCSSVAMISLSLLSSWGPSLPVVSSPVPIQLLSPESWLIS